MSGFDPALNQIVNVNISLATAGLTRAGFGTMGCLVPHLHSLDRVLTYANTAEMAVPGSAGAFLETEPAFIAATTHFAPLTDKPMSIKILRRNTNAVMVRIPGIGLAGEVYEIDINGVIYQYTRGVGETDAQVMIALAALINGGIDPTLIATPLSIYLLIQSTSVTGWLLETTTNMNYTYYVLSVVAGGGSGGGMAPDGDYIVIINGVNFTYAASGNTYADIATGLVASINSVTHDYFALDGGAGTFYIASNMNADMMDPTTPMVAGFAWDTTAPVALDLNGSYSIDETAYAALTLCKAFDNDWYGMMQCSRVQDDQESAAAWQEQSLGIYGTASSDPDTENVNPSTDASSLAAVLKALLRYRTFVQYSRYADAGANEVWPEAAWFGSCLTTNPDEETLTWKFKKEAGCLPEKFTLSQLNNIIGTYPNFNDGKNCGVYMTVGGSNITREGKVAAGEFIDIITGRDWLQVRITEEVYNALVLNKKIPMTDGGILVVSNATRKWLNAGLSTGFLRFDATKDATFGFILVTPLADNVDPTNRANRYLPGITFDATVAGAIHVTSIRGTISA